MRKKVKNSGTIPEFFSRQVHQARRFYLDRVASARQPLQVICGGSEHCQKDYKINRKDFPYFSIEFVARGKGALTLASEKYSLYPGRVFFYGPGIAQKITTDPEDTLVKYFVDFAGTKVEQKLLRYDLVPGQAALVAYPDEILRIFDDMIDNGLTGSRYSSLICATILEHLILKIADTMVTEDAGSTAAFTTYQVCRQFIQEHCLRIKSLEQISRECHVDAAYLCRLFRRFDYQSPYQCLMHLKMHIAAERLQTHDTLVKQVAFELGFSDPFHFSRAFKKVFGLSPEAFRILR